MARENKRLVGELRTRNATLEQTLETVRGLQAEVIQGEKLAGIGVLAAGVAHEINSPCSACWGWLRRSKQKETRSFYAKEIVDTPSEYVTSQQTCDDAREGLPRAQPVSTLAPRCVRLRRWWSARWVLRADGFRSMCRKRFGWGRQAEAEQVFVNSEKCGASCSHAAWRS